MSKSKIILTADDFGVDDSINKGIIALAKADIINSVEILPNYARSIESTLKLLDETKASNPNLELGVHLTVTSGKPILETDGLLPILCKGHFISAKKTNSTAVPLAIFEELKRQVEVLKSNDQIWSKVTHLTNHHDALWFFPEYTEMYIDIANHFNLPIRNPEVLPSWKEASYYKFIGPRNASKEDRRKSKGAYKLRENGAFESRDLDYYSTNYLDSSHYSLFRTILDSNPYKREKFIEIRQKELRKIFERIKESHAKQQSPQIVEALFHVREGGLQDSQVKLSLEERTEKGINAFDEFDLPDYNGITTTYFDGRSIEHDSLFHAHSNGGLKELFEKNQVEKGKWTNCIPRKLHKKQ
ncbi:MAG: ChbG/HpnK family deacetylase [Bacteroidota bacterium]